MSITATSESTGGYTPIDAGTYVARCYSMIHIGTIEEVFKGEPKMMNKVRISWELPTEMKVFNEEKGEQPLSVSKEFTLSMHEKSNLRKFLAGWRGADFTDAESKAFDVTVLIGKECMLSIIHKTSKSGNVYADISSCSTIPKGMTIAPQINQSFEFSYENFDEVKFKGLPDFLKDKMINSTEFQAIHFPEQPKGEQTDKLYANDIKGDASNNVPLPNENDLPPEPEDNTPPLESDDLPF